jgi:hypothetical protein
MGFMSCNKADIEYSPAATAEPSFPVPLTYRPEDPPFTVRRSLASLRKERRKRVCLIQLKAGIGQLLRKLLLMLGG